MMTEHQANYFFFEDWKNAYYCDAELAASRGKSYMSLSASLLRARFFHKNGCVDMSFTEYTENPALERFYQENSSGQAPQNSAYKETFF